jgi:uncharacterized damage-inducible protein DinB
VDEVVRDFPDGLLWSRPAGVASVGFHLQHLRGVVDRLFTYARGEPLTREQKEDLAAEGKPPRSRGGVQQLVEAFHQQVERALEQLRATDEQTLTHARTVGRKRLPSTVLGLLFHAAEHVQRHAGQLRVTVSVLRDGFPRN